MEIAAPLHPAWERCSPAVRKLHARNAAVLGSATLDRPVDACRGVVSGRAHRGRHGMAIRIAEARGIPVLNLGSMSPRAVCERLAAIRRADPLRLVEQEKSACRGSVRQAGGSGPPRRCRAGQRHEEIPAMFHPDLPLRTSRRRRPAGRAGRPSRPGRGLSRTREPPRNRADERAIRTRRARPGRAAWGGGGGGLEENEPNTGFASLVIRKEIAMAFGLNRGLHEAGRRRALGPGSGAPSYINKQAGGGGGLEEG